jgi:membrane protein YdbS with pleckstrin-like domain
VGLLILSIVLYLPMRLIGFAAVVLVLCEVGMAWTDWRVRHHPAGAVLTLLVIPFIVFVAGALVRFRTWLIQARQRWS